MNLLQSMGEHSRAVGHLCGHLIMRQDGISIKCDENVEVSKWKYIICNGFLLLQSPGCNECTSHLFVEVPAGIWHKFWAHAYQRFCGWSAFVRVPALSNACDYSVFFQLEKLFLHKNQLLHVLGAWTQNVEQGRAWVHLIPMAGFCKLWARQIVADSRCAWVVYYKSNKKPFQQCNYHLFYRNVCGLGAMPGLRPIWYWRTSLLPAVYASEVSRPAQFLRHVQTIFQQHWFVWHLSVCLN